MLRHRRRQRRPVPPAMPTTIPLVQETAIFHPPIDGAGNVDRVELAHVLKNLSLLGACLVLFAHAHLVGDRRAGFVPRTGSSPGTLVGGGVGGPSSALRVPAAPAAGGGGAKED